MRHLLRHGVISLYYTTIFLFTAVSIYFHHNIISMRDLFCTQSNRFTRIEYNIPRYVQKIIINAFFHFRVAESLVSRHLTTASCQTEATANTISSLDTAIGRVSAILSNIFVFILSATAPNAFQRL